MVNIVREPLPTRSCGHDDWTLPHYPTLTAAPVHFSSGLPESIELAFEANPSHGLAVLCGL